MKKLIIISILILSILPLNLEAQKRGRDNSTFYPTRPFYAGTTAPSTCTTGDTFFDTDATAGQNFYGCTATNTWTLQGAAGTFGESSLAGLVNNQTLWDGANASRTLTISLSGATDPVFTFANNSVSLNTPFIASSIALGTNPGSAGAIRVPNNTAITFRNAANSADLSIKLNTSDEFEVDAPINITSTPAAQLFTGVTSPSAPAGAEQWYFYADSVDNLPKYIYNGESEQTFYTTANPQTVVATANAGDSATLFFSSGTIEDARLPSSMADKVITGSLAIPQGASPTTDAAGECAIDTTTGQIQCHDGTAERAWPNVMQFSFVIPAPATTDDILLMKAPYGMFIVGIDGIITGTTNVVGQVQECTSAGASCADLDADITVDNDGAADDGSLTDSSIASGNWLLWKTTSVSGTPTFLTVTVRFRVVAD